MLGAVYRREAAIVLALLQWVVLGTVTDIVLTFLSGRLGGFLLHLWAYIGRDRASKRTYRRLAQAFVNYSPLNVLEQLPLAREPLTMGYRSGFKRESSVSG